MIDDAACRNRFACSRQPKQRLGVTRTGIVGAVVILVALLIQGCGGSRESDRRTLCRNNLKMISLGLLAYHDIYNAFPPAYTTDSDGRPLHSWRTLILPMTYESSLYEKIDLSKPWNDKANAAAYKTTPASYRCPSFQGPAGHTTYLAVVTPDSCIRPIRSSSRSDIRDGSSNTIMLVEVPTKNSVHWMAPTDADEELILGIGTAGTLLHNGAFHVALADGTVMRASSSLSAKNRRAFITISGNDTADWE